MASILSDNACQCAACGKIFFNEMAFDIHRVGNFVDFAPDYGRRCLSDGEMEAKGFAFVGTSWRKTRQRLTRFWADKRGATA